MLKESNGENIYEIINTLIKLMDSIEISINKEIKKQGLDGISGINLYSEDLKRLNEIKTLFNSIKVLDAVEAFGRIKEAEDKIRELQIHPSRIEIILSLLSRLEVKFSKKLKAYPTAA